MASRREAREAVFSLLFETDFHGEDSPSDILSMAREDREIANDPYIESTYFGVMEKRAVADVLIGRFSNGWKTTRISHVARAVLRLCTYEMLYTDVPLQVALNEAVELVKKFDDPKARPFINGVLNSIKNEIEAQGKGACAEKCEQALKDAEADSAESIETTNASDLQE